MNDPRSLPPGGVRPPLPPRDLPPGPHGRPPLRPAPPPRPVNHGAPPPPPPPPPEREPSRARHRSQFEDSDIGRLPPMYYEEEHDEEYDEHPVGELLDDEPPPARPQRRPAQRRPGKGRPAKKRGRKPQARRPAKKRKRSAGRRAAGWLLALALVGGLAAGAWFGARELLGFGFEDYQGSGKSDVVVQVVQGDSTSAIAQRLVDADVVASADAFVNAAESNTDMMAIRPGFYQVKTRMSGANAVKAILADDARVGQLEVRGGSQLDDLKDPNGKKIPGILSRMSAATCAKVNGKSTCVSAKALRATAGKADLVKLGAPKWLVDGAAQAKDKERLLEGMILPGIYDIKPGWDADRVLQELLSASASQFEAVGLPAGAKATGRTPYEIVVIASLIEREAVENDFGKVSRVIYNRMAKDMRLELDSTINYVLDRPHIRTSSADRAKAGPYNSYRNKTLPPTPISAPSAAALEAALKAPKGNWLYFVKCEKNGLSCFTNDFGKHQDNVADAKRRGVW